MRKLNILKMIIIKETLYRKSTENVLKLLLQVDSWKETNLKAAKSKHDFS